MRPIALDASLAYGSSTGDSTYWTGLIEGMSECADLPPVLLYSPHPQPRELPTHPSLRWMHLPATSKRFWSLVKFPLAARRSGAGVLHTQYNLSPLSLRGSITTIHDVSFFVGPEWFPPRDRLILQRGIPVSARRAKAIITVSETSKLEIQQFVRAATQKIHVTYNACPKWVKPVPRDEAKARLHDRYGIDAPFLLTVGTRWARKNMELAIEALDLLPEDFPHRLIITGKNGDGRIGRKGTAVGYVDQPTLCDLYSAATLYLAPSRHEGFGIPVLEAWRCGCPVLASSGGALPEVVSNPEAIMPSMNPQDWSNRIQELLRAPSNLQQMALLGAQRERTFSWKETAQRTISIYSRVQDELK